MPRVPRNLRRLIEDLAALSPEERAHVTAEAIVRAFRRPRYKPLPKDWTLPVLRGGGGWIGGDLRRENMYGDDGR